MIYNKLISGVLAFTIILSGCSLNLNLDDKDKKSSNDPQQSKVTQNDKTHQMTKMNQRIISIIKILVNLQQLKKMINNLQ